ncbi:psbP domain-containing protein 3, chloroplastic isoform X2 [Lotus japonicus]|uniref:psbP domain-containing protein 3, chloroplastic isoform X2 n=1 Tax=Lotus japonicus TaxID=34305 RepID=UPI00258BAA58|nr:psbP domain-containing protein 3, chloroplastic isoform X2 [Lotus japonicus]
MASISWSCCLHRRPTISDRTASAADKGFSPPITLEHHKKTPCLLSARNSSIEEGHAVNRRQLVFYTSLAAFAAAPSTVLKALALNDWEVGTGDSSGFKSLTAFYPKEASSSNVSVAITGLGPDFTKMESFGKVDEFAETLVSGLDRSWRKPPGVAAKLINSKSSKGIYYIEYSLQNPGESRRHLYSAIGMATNGWYNRLYTVTGQYVEEETDKYASEIQKAVTSFKFI